MSAPWLRAPVLLLRSPAVVAAVAAAGLILGTTAAATPLFLASAGSAAVGLQAAETCEWIAGASVGMATPLSGPVQAPTRGGVVTMDGMALFRQRDAAATAGMAGVGRLGEPVLTLASPTLTARNPETQRFTSVRLLHRGGGLDNVTKLGGGGPGAWVTEEAAESLGVRPGGRLTVVAEQGTAPLRVAGVYQDLKTGQTLSGPPTRGFWCTQTSRFYQPGPLADYVPPPVVLVDRDTYLDLGRRLGLRTEVSWESRLAGDLTFAQARETAAEIDRLERRLFADVGRIPPGTFGVVGQEFHSGLPAITERAARIRDALRTAVLPVAVAGTLVALLLVAAAGSYWADRRRVEVRLLAAKGAGPLAIGVKALLEMALPALAGGAAGWGLALWLVRTVGPSPLIEPGALRAAAVVAGALLVAGLVVLGMVAALRVLGETERPIGAPPSRWRRLPVEVVLLGLAAVSLQRMQLGGAVSVTDEGAPRVDLLALAFPLLFLTGMMRLAARVAGGLVPRLRSAGSRWPHAAWLAGRRLAASARPALVLLTAAGLSVGVGLYAATLTGSVRATLDAKAKTFVGGDVAVTVLSDAPLPGDLAATKVLRIQAARVGEVEVDVLGVDRATFERGAFWDATFASGGLDDLLAAIEPRDGEPAGAVVVGGMPGADGVELPRRGDAGGGSVELAVRAVASARSFPGQRSQWPLLVVDRSVLDGLPVAAEEQVWAKGERTAVIAALRAAGMRVADMLIDTRAVLDTTSFFTTSWTFGFLQALGVLTGCIVVGGLLLYVETRQRSRRVSYALSRRMGLSRRAHRASLLLELGAPLLAGCLAGAALALVAARLVYGELDSMPSLPPEPLLRLPLAAMLGTAFGAVLVVWVAALVAQRAADRTRVGEVLRLAE